MARAGHKALVKVSGTPASLIAEPTEVVTANKVYRIADSAKRVLSPTATITVDDDGTPTVEGYGLNRLLSRVTFFITQARGTITIDGTYLPMVTAAECKTYRYSLQANNPDASVMGTAAANKWRKRLQALKTVAGSLGQWYIDSAYIDYLINDDTKVLEFYSDNLGNFDVKMWAKLNAAGIVAQIEGLVDESVEFEGTKDAEGRTISL